MAGEQKRKERKVLITKALLLGYTIEWDPEDKGFFIGLPDGRRYVYNDGKGQTTWVHWPAPWLAAKEALKLSGVLDATDVSRDTGAGSGKNWKVRHRRGLRGGSKSLFEGDGTS